MMPNRLSGMAERVWRMAQRGRRWLRRVPAVPLAWIVAVAVRGAQWGRDWSVLRVARSLATGGRLRWDGLSPDDVVAIVYRLVPGTRGTNQCLFRSLVRFGLLHRTGTDEAVLCLGVQSPEAAEQFAHAWVEVNGTAIGEPSAPRQTHHLLFQYPGDGDD